MIKLCIPKPCNLIEYIDFSSKTNIFYKIAHSFFYLLFEGKGLERLKIDLVEFFKKIIVCPNWAKIKMLKLFQK